MTLLVDNGFRNLQTTTNCFFCLELHRLKNNLNDEEEAKETSNNNRTTNEMANQPTMVIEAKSWQKDSFGLFDYESKDLQTHNIIVTNTGIFLLSIVFAILIYYCFH